MPLRSSFLCLIGLQLFSLLGKWFFLGLDVTCARKVINCQRKQKSYIKVMSRFRSNRCDSRNWCMYVVRNMSSGNDTMLFVFYKTWFIQVGTTFTDWVHVCLLLGDWWTVTFQNSITDYLIYQIFMIVLNTFCSLSDVIIGFFFFCPFGIFFDCYKFLCVFFQCYLPFVIAKRR